MGVGQNSNSSFGRTLPLPFPYHAINVRWHGGDLLHLDAWQFWEPQNIWVQLLKVLSYRQVRTACLSDIEHQNVSLLCVIFCQFLADADMLACCVTVQNDILEHFGQFQKHWFITKKDLYLQWQSESGYSDNFPLSQGCHFEWALKKAQLIISCVKFPTTIALRS